MSRTRIIDIVLAVIIAVVLWAYVINVVNPPSETKLRSIPVELTGSDTMTLNKLAIVGDGDYTVDVVLAGARKDLAGVTADDVVATADLSQLKQGQNYIEVSVRSLRDSLTVSDVQSSRIQVYVEELVVVDKPLNIRYSEGSEGYEPTILGYASDVIAVSGARSLVDKVSEVRVDLDITDLAIDSPHTETLSGVPLDASGNVVTAVKLDDQIKVSAVLYAVKSVDLNLRITGAPAYGAAISGNTFPTSITIKGPARRLDAISSIDTAPINIEGMISSRTYTLQPELPAGIYLSDSCPDLTGTISLTDSGFNSFTYNMEDLSLLWAPAEYDVTLLSEGEFSVRARSTLEIIQNLTESDIVPFVDLSTLTPGTYSLPIEAMFGTGEIEYEFTPATVEVLISEEHETPPDADGEEGTGGSESGAQEGGEASDAP